MYLIKKVTVLNKWSFETVYSKPADYSKLAVYNL